jgi:hypothetical protein
LNVQVHSLDGKGGENPIDGIYVRTHSVKNHSPHGLKPMSAPKKPTLAKKMTDEEFLKLAVSKDDTRPVLQLVHGGVSADGFRMHFTNLSKKCSCGLCKTNKTPLSLCE